MRRLDSPFDACHGALDSPGRDSVVKVQAECDEHILGAKVHCQQLVEPYYPRFGHRGRADAGAHFRIDTFARQQALALISEECRCNREDESNDERGYAIKYRQIQGLAESYAEHGYHEAKQGRSVLEQDGKDGGIFAAVNCSEPIARPLGLAEFTESDNPDTALEDDTATEHSIIDVGVLDRMGGLDLI